MVVYQDESQTYLSDLAFCANNMTYLVLAKDTHKCNSSVSPYDRGYIYEKSEAGLKRKIKYRSSETGIKVMKDYESSEPGIKVRKDYESSEQGRKVRSNYEQKRLLESYEADTGFNIICCSCNEYKSRQACVNVIKIGSNESRFTQEEEAQFLLRDKNYNISLDGNFYVCISCKNQIESKKAQEE